MLALPPAPRPTRWRRHIDTLRAKLFLAIAGTSVALVLSVSLIYSWSFDQGLVEYLNRADEARLTPLIQRLADGWQEHGDWRWIADERQRWQDLLREVLGTRGSGRRDGNAASAPPHTAGVERSRPPADAPSDTPATPHNGAARPLPPLTIDPRLLLLDSQRGVLIGPSERVAQAVLKPIESRGQLVGYLGYVPRLQMVESVERVFVAQQNRKFAAIAAALAIAALLNAAWIARWLSRRLGTLSQGAGAVAQGHYEVRLPVQGHDELAQLAGDFNRMAAALQAARQARQQWIADIAHELRTPLTSLRAEIEALQDGVRPPTPDRLASLGQEATRLTRLVEDLRLLSLSDLGSLTYHLEVIDLGECLSDHLADAHNKLPTELQVNTQITPGLLVNADGDRFAQVLSNLLLNTVRYSLPPARLRVQLARHGDEAHLVWEDSAPGVPPEALPRLTERLFRVERSRTSSDGGSGLGLAIVRAIIEGHGGRMVASVSTLGGLRWDLWLPLHPSPPHD